MTAEPDADHATEIRLIRRDLGLNQRAMAARLGVSQVAISHWESGKLPVRTQLLMAVRGMQALSQLRQVRAEMSTQLTDLDQIIEQLEGGA